MGAVRLALGSALRRRRLQAVVIGTVLFLATGAATLALATLLQSQAPFEQAFAAANGAHLVIDYDGQITSAQLATTAHAAGVTESGGPWPVARVGLLIDGQGKQGVERIFEAGTVSGRAGPGGPVDRMTMVSGRWWRSPGEIVLSDTWARIYKRSVGQTIEVQQAPPVAADKGAAQQAPGASPSGTPSDLPVRTMTIVGIASSISTSGTSAWMSPSDIAALTPGQLDQREMLYRVSPSASTGDLAAAAAAITRSLPQETTQSTSTYLTARAKVDQTAAIFVPILLAFSVISLVAALFIIANVVTGVVLNGYREIGVMKAVGYTPGQVVAVLLGEVTIPAVVGAVAGVAGGTIASQPILAQTAQSFGLPPSFGISPVVSVAVLAVAAMTASLAAVGPALRASHLSVVTAIARGTAPSSRVGSGGLQRAIHGLALPTAARLGIAAGTARPWRAGLTMGALVVGVASLVFALGLVSSLQIVAADLIRDHPSPIRVDVDPRSTDPEHVTSVIAGNPGTAHFVSVGQRPVTVAQVGTVPFIGYRGDSAWIGYQLIHGRWFMDPGEAVAPTNFFRQSGLHVGDSTTLRLNGNAVSVTLVGEIFDQAREGHDDLLVRGTWADVARLAPGLTPSGWEALPRPGTNLREYRSALQDADPSLSAQVVEDSSTNAGFLLFEGVIGILGVVLVFISLSGVFNTVMLETRQRARETAILKAIGMTPGQVVASVVASVIPVGLIAGLVGVPVGLLLHRVVLGFMADAAAKTDLPPNAINVFSPGLLIALGVAGLAIGAIGAFLPARRVAGARIAPVLQSE